MPDLRDKGAMDDRLQAPGFERATPDAPALTDPIADTPMIVTLDQLQPYENNPRATRNPRYDDIKASIRARGLDSPPPITRRPGDAHFIIRNGGNTRLAILHELWTETKEERFYRVRCLFRPWTPRGEIVVLTGHLAENELHGSLTFIERALGIAKARELYEAEDAGRPLTQTELARRLTQDGYPITQSHISRMQEAVTHLLPAIPSILYAGLGKPQIDRLTALRRAAERVHVRHAGERAAPDAFTAMFQDVLSKFDGSLAAFDIQRVRDELIGELSVHLGIDYHELSLQIVDAESRHQALTREPTSARDLTSPPEQTFHVKQTPVADSSPSTTAIATSTSTAPQSPLRSPGPATTPAAIQSPRTPAHASDGATRRSQAAALPPRTPSHASPTEATPADREATAPERVQNQIVSPEPITDHLQADSAIQRLGENASGESVRNDEPRVPQAMPAQEVGLHPISDTWYVEPQLDVPDRLQAHIAQLARDIGQDTGIADFVESTNDGLGFRCVTPAVFLPLAGRATLMLLSSLSARHLRADSRSSPEDLQLGDYLGALLQGVPHVDAAGLGEIRLSDTSLATLFRLIRLSRRFLELQSSDAPHPGVPRPT